MVDVISEYFTLRNARRNTEAEGLLMISTELGLQRIKSFSFVQMCLAFLLLSFGAATLVVASTNIGFPVFNPGPVLTGILLLCSGGLGFRAAVKGLKLLNPENIALSRSVRCLIISNFSFSVATVTFAAVSCVFAFLSGAACAGADIYFHIHVGHRNDTVDIKKFCHPNRRENSALAFVDGFLCLAVIVWSVLGLCLYCRYGSWLGLRKHA